MSRTPRFSAAAVVAPHGSAAEAGRAVLAEGGNAIEAMVAMAGVIAVAYPHMNGLGGDAFWTIRTPDGRVRAIEACGFAGSGATISAYRDKGYQAVPVRGPDAALTVAGTVGGWKAALELSASMGGRMPLADLLGAAEGHAKAGLPVSESEGRYPVKETETLFALADFVKHFRGEGGKALPAGTLRKQPALAGVFDQLAHAGLDDFYRGDLARSMASDLKRAGTPVTLADLEAYAPRWREPLAHRLDDAMLYNNPPPTQGLASLILHGIFGRMGLADPNHPDFFHAMIEATKRAYAIRDRIVTDFDWLKADPSSVLTPERIAAEARAIVMDRAAAWPFAKADGDTIWMGAIDAQGCAVSFIQSIYWEYGSGVVLPETGLLWQNRGTAFSLDPKAMNPLEPGRRPFHTLNAPLAVFDDGRVLSYGSMGGDGQPQFQAQIFFPVVKHGFGIDEALDRPRFLFGKTWGKPSATLKVENRFDPNVLDALDRRGHVIEVIDKPYADMFGHAGMVLRTPGGEVCAQHDPRADGGAAGL